MANTITLSTAGKIAYEDFAGQTDGDAATSAEFTISAPVGKQWTVRTQNGQKCIQPSDTTFAVDNTANAISASYANSNKEIMVQRIAEFPTLADRQQVSFYKTYGALGYWWLEAYISGVSWWQTTSNRFSVHGARNATTNTWYLIQTWLSESLNESRITILSSGVEVYRQTSTFKTNLDFATDAQTYVISGDSRGGTFYMGRLGFLKSRYITVAGLTAGMSVRLLDSSDMLMQSKRADTTSVTFDLMGLPNPVSYKFQFYGTDGTELLKTTAQTIFGGDTWTYSGDTAGPVKSRKRIIIDGGVIG